MKSALSLVAAIVLLSVSATALQSTSRETGCPKHLQSLDAFLKTAVSAGLATSFIFAPPANAIDTSVTGGLQKAIIEASDSAYPVLESLSPDTVNPLANKISTVLTKKANPTKLTNALDSAASALLSIPDNKLSKFAGVVEDSYKGVGADSCQLIPVPVDAIESFTSSITGLEASKVDSVLDRAKLLQSKVPTRAGGICLPGSAEGLEKIWVGQTELFLSIPRSAKRDLAEKAASAVKSIPSSELLRVLPDGKKVLGGVDRKVASRFQQSSQALDKLIKQDGRFQ